MVYFRKILSNDITVKYEYGASEDEYIGTVEFRVNVPTNTPFKDRNPQLDYYKDFSFCEITASALQGIEMFMLENNYPDKYLILNSI